MNSSKSPIRLPDQLANLMFEGVCVAYVGAGFSMEAGMPGWKEFLQKLSMHRRKTSGDIEDLIHAEQALKDNDFLLAATTLRNCMSTFEIRQCVDDCFGKGFEQTMPRSARFAIQLRLDHLLAANWAGIVTTNYDSLIEDALFSNSSKNLSPARLYTDPSTFGEALHASRASELFLVKLHGTNVGGNIILTTEDYEDHYRSDFPIWTFLEALMLRYHVIFLGCSLEDEIVRVRRRLNKSFSGVIPPAYAVLPETPQNRSREKALQRKASVEPIFYMRSHDRDHEGFRVVLERLSQMRPSRDLIQMVARPPVDRIAYLAPRNKALYALIAKADARRVIFQQFISELNTEHFGHNTPERESDEVLYRLYYLTSIQLLSYEELSNGQFAFSVPSHITDDDLRSLKDVVLYGSTPEKQI